jgi:hypothetical protein
MLLVPVRWAGRVWALPFLSILAPSERYATERGKPHKKITDRARQALLLVRRWWPEREIVWPWPIPLTLASSSSRAAGASYPSR